MVIFHSLPFLKYFFLLLSQPLKLKAAKMSVLKVTFRAERLAAVSLGDLKPRGKKLKHMEKEQDGCSLDR